MEAISITFRDVCIDRVMIFGHGRSNRDVRLEWQVGIVEIESFAAENILFAVVRRWVVNKFLE